MNNVNIIGNITKNIELRKTPNNKPKIITSNSRIM